jgi:inorganic pyrophosphatase
MYSNRGFNRWRRHPWHGLHARAEEAPEDIVQVYVEMTPDDVVKYELDKGSGFLIVDRPQRTTSSPPALYGFIPRTYCAEEDGGEADDKIVAVLEGDNIWGGVHDIADLPDIKTERLQHYFSTYKMIPGKETDIKVDFVYGREEALKVIAAAEKDYENHFGHLHIEAKAKE